MLTRATPDPDTLESTVKDTKLNITLSQNNINAYIVFMFFIRPKSDLVLYITFIKWYRAFYV